ncbi:SRPBCC family protein [Salinibacterium soli]|uniref:SRPBCC family protein n=1 Tax=Antiquaquibacter soli TaxID=3064523 RepID=A0ABT9BMD5_9MICO|nr:SRPBCC family protein [Protaetiibacter sp. WY-16]MDO7882134.1 SRPBCC family protein [Protaetiibacter sp. WY-16]
MTFDVTLTRALGATPARVWEALTTSELADWFWPKQFETVVAVDPITGGGFSISSEPMGMAVDARILSAVPGRELVLDWGWRGEDARTTVTLTLEPSAAGTALTLAHAGNADQETADDHRAGWESCLDRLPAHLERVER